MSKYRKKPVVIDAVQWWRNGDHPEDESNRLLDSDDNNNPLYTEGKVVRYYRTPDLNGQDKCKYCEDIMHNHGWIDTIQGGHIVCPGDWIIKDNRAKKGEHGYCYPCKPDIFEQTYEKA